MTLAARYHLTVCGTMLFYRLVGSAWGGAKMRVMLAIMAILHDFVDYGATYVKIVSDARDRAAAARAPQHAGLWRSVISDAEEALRCMLENNIVEVTWDLQ